MSKKIRIAIAGVGNCASALIQGVSYYNKNKESIGLTAYNLGGFEPGDIEFVAAFDVVDTKVGKDLSEAIFEKPNNTVKIYDVNKMDVKVERAEVLDGIGRQANFMLKDVLMRESVLLMPYLFLSPLCQNGNNHSKIGIFLVQVMM
jgi:myo-inositol-1-phosphate synthase